MLYSIPGSTKILIYIYILKQQHHFLKLVGTLCACEFAMVQGVCILLFLPGRKGTSSSYTFSCTVIKKIKNPFCGYIIMARSLLNWKTQTEKD